MLKQIVNLWCVVFYYHAKEMEWYLHACPPTDWRPDASKALLVMFSCIMKNDCWALFESIMQELNDPLEGLAAANL